MDNPQPPNSAGTSTAQEIIVQIRQKLHQASQPVTTILMLSEMLGDNLANTASQADLNLIYEQAFNLRELLANLNELVKKLGHS